MMTMMTMMTMLLMMTSASLFQHTLSASVFPQGRLIHRQMGIRTSGPLVPQDNGLRQTRSGNPKQQESSYPMEGPIASDFQLAPNQVDDYFGPLDDASTSAISSINLKLLCSNGGQNRQECMDRPIPKQTLINLLFQIKTQLSDQPTRNMADKRKHESVSGFYSNW